MAPVNQEVYRLWYPVILNDPGNKQQIVTTTLLLLVPEVAENQQRYIFCIQKSVHLLTLRCLLAEVFIAVKKTVSDVVLCYFKYDATCNSALVSWSVLLFLCFTVLLHACAQGNTVSHFSVSYETKGHLNLYKMHELYSMKMELYPVWVY